MRTNIDIDDKLMADALAAGGLGSKRATVEEGLRLLISVRDQSGIRRLRGTIEWEGDLDAMRRDD